MKNKGFTLIELLAVIVIISILSALVFPAVNDIIKEGKKVTYETQIARIISASYDYTLKYPTKLPNSGEIFYITLAELKNEGLIDYNFINPNNKKLFEDNLVISINNVGAGYKEKANYSKLEGDYLYKVEVDKLENTPTNKKPNIILSNLTKNSTGNYVLTLNLNSKYSDYQYTATDYKNNNITELVNVNIYKDKNIVDSVDTKKEGLYKINYTVVDSEGNSNITTLSVIIDDEEPPKIYFDESTKISKSVTNFDLDKNVTCTDNSEICNITHSGSISYGVSGKYIIEYKSQDPSGNTATRKRVITIE